MGSQEEIVGSDSSRRAFRRGVRPSFLFFLLSACVVSLTLLVSGGRDFYSILEVKKNASPSDIKKSYRKLSLKYHPDKNPDDESAKSKFQDLSSAYEVLSDPDKRRKYDQCGEECVNEQQGGGGGMNPFGDIFGDIFGHFGGSRFHQQGEQVGGGVKMKIKVTLEDIYVGREMEITYTRRVLCPHCRGTGADNPEDVEICPKCNGQGVVIEKQQLMPGFVQQVQKTCPKCNGQGKKVTSQCHVCHGGKVVNSLDDLLLFIEKGIPDGKEYSYKEAADEHVDKRSGEVIFKVQTVPHPYFKRDGNNLKMSVTISLRQALLGFEKEIKHLDGHKVKLSRNKITKPGEIEKIVGEGMPIYDFPSDNGDLYVTYVVKFPEQLSEEQTTLFRKVFQ